MKMLHLADLHIGRKLMNYSLIEDQKYIFGKVLALCDSEGPDVILIAGDVYDKAAPSEEAVELFDYFLNELYKRKIPVLVISGNHDSSQRIGYAAGLLKNENFYFSKPFSGNLECVQLNFADGPVDFYLMPFVKPGQVRAALRKEGVLDEENIELIKTFDDAVKVVTEGVSVRENRRNVILCHQFVMGAALASSEEMNVGALDVVSARHFEKFNYTALGHIHKTQNISGGKLRYPGTLLKYNVDEAGDRKSVTFVNMDGDGNISFDIKEISPLRDLKILCGKFEEIKHLAESDESLKNTYVKIVLTDEEEIPGALGTLQRTFPYFLCMAYDNKRTREDKELEQIEHIEEKSVFELFEEFYENRNNAPMSDEQIKVIKKMTEEEE